MIFQLLFLALLATICPAIGMEERNSNYNDNNPDSELQLNLAEIRRIKEEQDRAFAESLRKDQEKERQREREKLLLAAQSKGEQEDSSSHGQIDLDAMRKARLKRFDPSYKEPEKPIVNVGKQEVEKEHNAEQDELQQAQTKPSNNNDNNSPELRGKIGKEEVEDEQEEAANNSNNNNVTPTTPVSVNPPKKTKFGHIKNIFLSGIKKLKLKLTKNHQVSNNNNNQTIQVIPNYFDWLPDEIKLNIIKNVIDASASDYKMIKRLQLVSRDFHRLTKDDTIQKLFLNMADQFVQAKLKDARFVTSWEYLRLGHKNIECAACKYDVAPWFANHVKNNPNAIHNFGQLNEKPLLLCANYRSPNVTKILLDHGADANARDDVDRTALIYLCANYPIDEDEDNTWRRILFTANVLLKNGANVNAQDTYRKTALAYLVTLININGPGKGRMRLARLLLAYGANINIKNRWNDSAYDAAKNSKLRNLLREYKKK